MVWALYPFPGLSKMMVWALYGIFEESLGGGTSHCTFLQGVISQPVTEEGEISGLKFTVGGEGNFNFHARIPHSD